MNDNELDELLNSWTVAPPPASLRERIRAAFPARSRRPWFSAFGPRLRVIAAAAVFLLVVAKAAPMILWAPSAAANARYVIETESTDYSDTGSPAVRIYSASYDADVREIPLSRTIPNDPLGTIGARALDLLTTIHKALIGPIYGHFAEHHTVNTAALRSAGCAVEPVFARETVLSYPTVAIRHLYPDKRRRTAWMAPDLGCFALRYTAEAQQPDGTFRLVAREEAVKVTVNR
ncbi:MAG: hypothetical protein M3N54_06350 [Acidobacteriota bacterium]|nr:hypothetical protein [Acidobacteriota bacterium]